MWKAEKSTYSRKVLPTPLTGSLNTAAFMLHNLRKRDLNLSSHPELNRWLCARMFQTTSQWSKAIISGSHRTKTSLHFSTQGSLCPELKRYTLTSYSRNLEDAGRSDHGSAATQGATVWPGPFGLERNQWRELQLRSKQILSGLKKEKETAIHCLFSHERGALTVTLTCWSKQKGSDSSCKLSYAISCYKTLQIVKVYWDSKNTSINEWKKIPQWLLKTKVPSSAQETDSYRSVSGKDQHNHSCSTHL